MAKKTNKQTNKKTCRSQQYCLMLNQTDDTRKQSHHTCPLRTFTFFFFYIIKKLDAEEVLLLPT